jgi:hypothetical protein
MRLPTTNKNGTAILTLILVMSLGACNTSEFSGSAVKKQQAGNANTSSNTNSNNVDANASTNTFKPSSDDPVDFDNDTNTSIKIPNNNTVDTNINIQPSSDVVIGGLGKVFHVGDGQMDPRAGCYFEVSMLSLSGKAFYFSFEVTEDNTQVQISIDKVCGIDYSGNSVMLIRSDSGGAGPLKQLNITPGASMVSLGSMTLNRGTPTDFDDFVVGNVRIHADKSSIRVGQVTAQ